MTIRSGGSILAILVAAVLLGQAADLQAHPCLVGQYVLDVPGCGPTIYDFGPGEYQGNGVWKGPVLVTIGGIPMGDGRYDLRLSTETLGTIGIRDGKKISTAVGLIDIASGAMEYMNVTFHRKTPSHGPPHLPAYPLPQAQPQLPLQPRPQPQPKPKAEKYPLPPAEPLPQPQINP